MYIYSVDMVCKFIQGTKLFINLASVVLFLTNVLERTFFWTNSRFSMKKIFFANISHTFMFFLYAINEAYKLHKNTLFHEETIAISE